MPDYIFMLESRLSAEQSQALNRMQLDAQELGLNLYLVGGAVRDLMCGAPIRDLDFVVEGNPQRLIKRLEAGRPRRLGVDNHLRTAEITLDDGVSLSVEMARTEFYRAPGKNPEMAPAPILEDLRRRDFSINAMGISLTPGSRGLLLDPTNGLADVESRELRVLHNYSFVHDSVRLLRLVRFVTRLGFKPEARTRELFEAALERNYQKYIRAAALGCEIEQIARERNVPATLKALANHELLEALHVQLPRRKPDYDALTKFQKYREQAEQAGYRFDPLLPVLHYITRRLRGRARTQFFRNAGLTKTMVKQLQALEKEAAKVVKQLSRRRSAGPREVYHLLTPVPVELLLFVLAEYTSRKKLQSKAYNYLFKYRPLRKKLPVRELQLMGVSTGPKFDQILEKYFEALLDGRLRSRAQQLRYLRALAGLPKPSRPPAPARKKASKEAAPPQEKVAPAAPSQAEATPAERPASPVPKTAAASPAASAPASAKASRPKPARGREMKPASRSAARSVPKRTRPSSGAKKRSR